MTIPEILQHFNPDWLLPYPDGLKRKVETKFLPLAKKKIRSQDTGKHREFEKLKLKFMEAYERKKTEEKKYFEKIKNSTKRSCLPDAGGTMRFRRMET